MEKVLNSYESLFIVDLSNGEEATKATVAKFTDLIAKNGEIIEILTSSSSKGPSRDWLNIVKTSEARTKIRGWFKKEKRPENIVTGKSMIDGEFKKYGRAYTETQRNDIVGVVGQKFGFMSADDFYNTLGYGGITVSKVSLKLKEEFERVVKAPAIEEIREDIGVEDVKISPAPKNIKSNGGIVVDGADGCLVKFARCCNPLPGDDVIGFITKGYGISIHKIDCPNVIMGKSNPASKDRWLEAHWENSQAASTSDVYEAQLKIHVYDRIGIIADITGALSEMKVFILQINTLGGNSDKSTVNLKVCCKNVEHYHSIVSRLKSLDGVIDVTRGFS